MVTKVEPFANFELHITSCIGSNCYWLHKRPCERQEHIKAFQYGIKKAEMLQYSVLEPMLLGSYFLRVIKQCRLKFQVSVRATGT